MQSKKNTFIVLEYTFNFTLFPYLLDSQKICLTINFFQMNLPVTVICGDWLISFHHACNAR